MLYRAGCHKQLRFCVQWSERDPEHCREILSEDKEIKGFELRISLRPFGPQAHPGCKL